MSWRKKASNLGCFTALITLIVSGLASSASEFRLCSPSRANSLITEINYIISLPMQVICISRTRDEKNYIGSSRQWAAVTTCCAVIRVPPQKKYGLGDRLFPRIAIHGHAPRGMIFEIDTHIFIHCFNWVYFLHLPTGASFPPTIREWMASLKPQSSGNPASLRSGRLLNGIIPRRIRVKFVANASFGNEVFSPTVSWKDKINLRGPYFNSQLLLFFKDDSF